MPSAIDPSPRIQYHQKRPEPDRVDEHQDHPKGIVGLLCDRVVEIATHDLKRGAYLVAACVRTVLHLAPVGERRPLALVEAVEAWSCSEGSLDDVRVARAVLREAYEHTPANLYCAAAYLAEGVFGRDLELIYYATMNAIEAPAWVEVRPASLDYHRWRGLRARQARRLTHLVETTGLPIATHRGSQMTHRTPAPIALLDAARPGLVQLRERIRATLSPEACAQVDAHVTQAQRLLEDVFAGLPVWMLQDSDELWARAADVAALMEVDRSVVIHRTASSITRREFSEGDIRRGVTDNDVSTSIVHHVHSHPSDADCLTTSPRGVTMLNLRAIRRLVMTCDGERGVRFRNGLDRAIEFADQAERVILELLLAEREQPRGARAAPATGDELAIEAHQTIRALIATGRKTIPSALMQQALGAPAPIRAPTPTSDNPTRRFLDECTRPDHNSAVLLALLYERYAQWARASSVPPLTRRRFSAELTRSDLPSFRGAGNRTFKRGLKLL